MRLATQILEKLLLSCVEMSSLHLFGLRGKKLQIHCKVCFNFEEEGVGFLCGIGRFLSH